MSKPKLHLDADTSRKALLQALLKRNHDLTRMPQPGLPKDASDEYQLLWATAQGRIIFTHNIRDFIHMTDLYPHHAGILLGHQPTHDLPDLIRLLDRALASTKAEEWIGQVRWLSEWVD
jgi:hypothetical protein